MIELQADAILWETRHEKDFREHLEEAKYKLAQKTISRVREENHLTEMKERGESDD